MSELSKVLAKLQKAHKEAIADVKEVGTINRIFLESPQLNFSFGGGFGLGRIYEFSGPESGGKSTLATYIGGELQRKNTERPIVVFVDFEYAFDEKFANTLGLKTDEESFVLLRPTSGEEGFLMLAEMIKTAPIGLIIWDSLAATPSIGQVEDPNKASFGGTAKVFANGLKYINPYLARTDTSMIVINQERANVGGMYGPDFQTTGGYAIKYYSSWRGRITRVDWIKEKGVEVGIYSKVRNTKNKIGIPRRVAELQLKFAEGFDSNGEYVKFLIDLGIIEQRGAWFYNEDWEMKVNGRDAVFSFLEEHPDIFEMAKNTVNAALSGATILDEEEAAIDSEEEEYMETMKV